MANKLPKSLDPQDTFNKVYRKMHETYDAAEEIYYNADFTLEEKLEVIAHSSARASGMADMLRELGYEVRNSQGILLPQLVMNKFYALKQRVELDIRRKGA